MGVGGLINEWWFSSGPHTISVFVRIHIDDIHTTDCQDEIWKRFLIARRFNYEHTNYRRGNFSLIKFVMARRTWLRLPDGDVINENVYACVRVWHRKTRLQTLKRPGNAFTMALTMNVRRSQRIVRWPPNFHSKYTPTANYLLNAIIFVGF